MGLISLTDRRAANGAQSLQEHKFFGLFAKEVAIHRSILDSDSPERGAECQETAQPEKNAAQLKAVPVGKLLVQLGEKILEVPFVAKQGAYGGTLNKGMLWPVGKNAITAAGSDVALGFEVSHSMPQFLEDVTVNGTPMTQTISITEKQPVELGWKAQESTSSDDIMGVEMSGDWNGQKLGFFCEVKEMEIVGNWQVPQAWVDRLPAGLASARIYVYRQHRIEQKGTSFDKITLHGMREHQAVLTVNP